MKRDLPTKISNGTRMIAGRRSRSHDMSEPVLDGLDTASRRALVDMLALVRRNLLLVMGEANPS